MSIRSSGSVSIPVAIPWLVTIAAIIPAAALTIAPQGQANVLLASGGAILLGSIGVGASLLVFVLNQRDQAGIEDELRRAEESVARLRGDAHSVIAGLERHISNQAIPPSRDEEASGFSSG